MVNRIGGFGAMMAAAGMLGLMASPGAAPERQAKPQAQPSGQAAPQKATNERQSQERAQAPVRRSPPRISRGGGPKGYMRSKDHDAGTRQRRRRKLERQTGRKVAR